MKRVEIGRVTRPHGIRGEIRVQLHWELSETLHLVSQVTLLRKGAPIGEYTISSARRADKAFLLRLRGVDDRDAAEALRGAAVVVPREALPPLAEGEYYLSDLVGASVLGPEGKVGEVVDIRVHPTVDTLVVRLPDGRLAEQPLAEPWLARVDAPNGVVELASLEGLI